MSKHDCQTIRELGYKSCIPYFIMFDTELTIQHLRLYTLIEQMESNPNPKITPSFSYAWFARIIGVEPRGAIKIAKRMKDKGYITHTQKQDGKWIWGTAKKMIIDDSANHGVSDEGGVSSQDTGGVSYEDTGGVSSQDTQNTKKNNYQKEETTNYESSRSIVFSKSTDQNLLNQKLSRDLRTDEEFLAECVEHVDNHSKKSFPRLQRANALVKLLAKLNADDVIFRPKKDEDKPQSQKVTPLFTEEESQLMQEALHAKKMAGIGQDINIFIKPEKLAQAEELLARAKAMEAKSCQNPSSPKKNARENCLTSASSLVSHLNLSQQGS